ncbi:permease-like cell division protein FtsX, partial [Candidatus Margulisiibacteriota bacterium]
MFSNLEFFIVEALRSFRRGSLMSLVAIGTISVSLVIFGLFVILVVNLGNIVGTVSSRMDISAYVENDLSLESAGALQLELSRLEGVERVDFISRTEAWRKFKQDFGATLNLDDILSDNPLPHTFSIKVRTPELLPVVAKRVGGFADVDDVRYSGNLIEQIRSVLDGVRIGGAALVILIAVAT